ncbi:hypothetical protein C482_11223 [Natrialba chahannaoensis JCM 10990]|uniref:Uncharacterized protein n=2 Tax=Natrialba chahannaoensis TaxID=68911 RepID=M0AKG1_9EURY|nr:hypothetical protein C482_11223 [Natrialba chahannaoensis JCM 10990]
MNNEHSQSGPLQRRDILTMSAAGCIGVAIGWTGAQLDAGLLDGDLEPVAALDMRSIHEETTRLLQINLPGERDATMIDDVRVLARKLALAPASGTVAGILDGSDVAATEVRSVLQMGLTDGTTATRLWTNWDDDEVLGNLGLDDSIQETTQRAETIYETDSLAATIRPTIVGEPDAVRRFAGLRNDSQHAGGDIVSVHERSLPEGDVAFSCLETDTTADDWQLHDHVREVWGKLVYGTDVCVARVYAVTPADERDDLSEALSRELIGRDDEDGLLPQSIANNTDITTQGGTRVLTEYRGSVEEFTNTAEVFLSAVLDFYIE